MLYANEDFIPNVILPDLIPKDLLVDGNIEIFVTNINDSQRSPCMRLEPKDNTESLYPALQSDYASKVMKLHEAFL
eukprot:10591438-Ditylum_brightwellii.AAC.1